MFTTRRSRRVGTTPKLHRRSPPALTPTPTPMRFFKVVLPSAKETKMLRIPPKFVKKFGSELSNVATLITPSGFKHRIRLKRDKREIWFHRGWSEFAEHHSIREGHFLVFDYRGNSGFQVMIFDTTACEIDYPREYIDISDCDNETEDEGKDILSSQGNENWKTGIFNGSIGCDWIPVASNSGANAYKGKRSAGLFDGLKERVIALDESYESDASLDMKMERDMNIGPTVIEQSKKPARGKNVLCDHHIGNKSKKNVNRKGRMQFTKPQSIKKIEPLEVHQEGAEIFVSQKLSCIAAVRKAEMLNLKNPSFIVIIRPHHFQNGVLYVPAEFVRRFLASAPDPICIQDPKGRNWRLSFKKERDYLRLCSGWRQICQANSLKGGDICVFELIQQKENFGLKLYRVR